jgi:hypothetical protein
MIAAQSRCHCEVFTMHASRAVGILGKAFTASIIGCFAGAIAGYGLASLSATIYEVKLTREELQDIYYLGFPYYTSSGITFLATLICSVGGGIGCFVGSAIAESRNSTRIGILAGIVTVLVALLASGILTSRSTHWHETKIVETIGCVVSIAVGIVLARAVQRQEDLDRTVQPAVSINGTSQSAGSTDEKAPPGADGRFAA